MFAVTTVVLAGCAGLAERSQEETVAKRSQERWDALVKGDVKAAYGFLSPGSRAVMDLPGYESTIRRGFWTDAKVQKVECGSAQACEAHVAIEYDFQGRRTKTPLRETWIKEGANWWLLQK